MTYNHPIRDSIFTWTLLVLFVIWMCATATGCSNVTVSQQAAAPPVVSAPPPATPPPATPPVATGDETEALQTLLAAGGTVQLECRTYNTTRMLNVAVSGTVLKGCPGTVIKYTPPPAAEVKGCYTDRALSTNCGFSTNFPLQVAANILKGATSFEAANASDAAQLAPGDWVYLAAWDPGISDAFAKTAYATVADWVQVASVDGTTVNVVTPFRQSFVTTIPFQAAAGGAVNGGISFQKVIPLTDIVIENLTIQVEPNGDGTGAAANANVIGLMVIGTLNTLVQNVTVNVPGGRGLYTESSKGTTFDTVTVNGKQLDEFAESVDLTIKNCTFAVTEAPAIGLDLGTGFFTIENNFINQSSGAGLYALYNVHDGVISGNTIGVVSQGTASRSLGMFLYGSPNIKITGNTLQGGEGASNTGILAEADTNAKLPEPSTGDVQSGNTITGFAIQTAGI